MIENNRLEIMWPSYNNIHKNIKIIDKLGYFTIKIDGTNFSISDTWKIQSISDTWKIHWNTQSNILI